MDKDAIAATAAKVTYTGAGGAIFFGLTAHELAALGGLGLAVIGLIVQVTFKVLGYIELKRHHAELEGKK